MKIHCIRAGHLSDFSLALVIITTTMVLSVLQMASNLQSFLFHKKARPRVEISGCWNLKLESLEEKSGVRFYSRSPKGERSIWPLSRV
jgi:hypothetical protein